MIGEVEPDGKNPLYLLYSHLLGSSKNRLYSHTRGDGCLPNLPFFWSRVAPDRELKFFGLSAQTSANRLAGVLLTQFAT
jgi:hypothetical protein